MPASHHALIRSALAAHGGKEVDTQGDAFFAVFSSPTACLATVIHMQQAIGGVGLACREARPGADGGPYR